MLVTLRQLQYVIAVADTGSFSKAADLVFAEQSTVSQQVRVLEDRLGIAVFDRTTLPITVTEEGAEMVQKARSILDSVEDLLKPFKSTPNRFG
jgi:LysR family transcriptional regulator, hydrogen peroxide-inducible genes activator